MSIYRRVLDPVFELPNFSRGVIYFKYCLLRICAILFYLKALKLADLVILFIFSFLDFTLSGNAFCDLVVSQKEMLS
jgi:hypothetical protein